MSDTKNPEEKLHDLYADLVEAKKPYIEANNAFTASPTPENKAKLDEAASVYEAAVAKHNEHKDSTEYKDHVFGQDNAPAGLKKVYVKDDFSNTYKPTLEKVVADAPTDQPVEQGEEVVVGPTNHNGEQGDEGVAGENIPKTSGEPNTENLV